jgi:tRNA-specific 2-thiouridylase
MSGGVDSSVAAYLMKKQGYDCIGCTMKLFAGEDAGIPKGRTCCSLEDVEDARAVAYSLGMPYYVFNFTSDFRREIIDRFVESYGRGMTPNPCIDCNRYMKFGKLFERALVLGCDKVVTGHYARIEKQGGLFVLKKAADESKDQSYVLYNMTQEELAHTEFPLGGMSKSEVRAIAQELGFGVASKPDSQDICFVPDGDYAKIVELHSGRPAAPGDFIDSRGSVIGRHRGIIHYTIGQRRGLGISSDEPLYVLAIDPVKNTVTVGKSEELFKKELLAEDFNWISGAAPGGPVRCGAKIRYRNKEQPASAVVLEDGIVKVSFDESQRAITPGQAVVLYDGELVLGGGVIKCSL